ncbi:hypothetical protein ACE198_22255 [Neobacillus sp. KR4-4]|uniref:hypothetical protein n=1 Tax=Neobacillus sp. KR4-4 TaxID=3344872 RepID=UPI0035CA71A1
MDTRVQELVDFTRNKWGLDNYYLHTYHFYRKLNALNETIYTLSMEWYPSHITDQEDEDYNPDGTAAIDLNIQNRQFESVIFVGGETFSNRSLIQSNKIDEIIKFIENETGLIHGKQFHLDREKENEYFFRSRINGVAVAPSGILDIKFNTEGKLTYFSTHGPFPSVDKVTEETFSLTLEDVEHIAKDQLVLIKFPLRKQKKLIPVYCLEEIYVTNDISKTLPFIYQGLVYTIDEKIEWQTTNKKSFKRKHLNLIEDLTADQAFSFEPHPNLTPISDNEKEKCIRSVRDFLSQVYPSDSGKWLLKTLHRDNGFIQGKLGLLEQDISITQRKLMLLIDPNKFKVLNYMDNKDFLEIHEKFQEIEGLSFDSEDAYKRIKSTIELKPVYVYDFEQKNYILCGRIDSDYGINGINGEVLELNDYL